MKKLFTLVIAGMFTYGLHANNPKSLKNDYSFKLPSFSGSKVSTFNSAKKLSKYAAFEEGKVTIIVGYGFPNLGKAILKAYEDEVGYSAFGFGPLHFKTEYGLSDKISFGLSVNYISFGGTYKVESYDANFNPVTYDYKVSYSSISFNPRMNIHFGVSEKLDPFWGIGVGYKISTWKMTTDDPLYTDESFSSPIPIGFESTIGLRYFFTEMIGAYVEMGIAKSLIQGGLAVAF